jgi:hypothetical protein
MRAHQCLQFYSDATGMTSLWLQGATNMQRIVSSLAVLLVALDLSACGSLTVQGEVIPADGAASQEVSRFSLEPLEASTQNLAEPSVTLITQHATRRPATESPAAIRSSATPAMTRTPSPTAIPTATATFTRTPSPTLTPTLTASVAAISTPTPTFTSTSTQTFTSTPFSTFTPTFTQTPFPTITPSPTLDFLVGQLVFAPDVATVLDRNSTFYFGVNILFSNNNEVRVMLLAFRIYADEAVPPAGTCIAQGGSLPSTHPGRAFWSPGVETVFAPGSNHVYSQLYQYTAAVPGTTHLVLWLIVRQNSLVRYCGEQAYAFSP